MGERIRPGWEALWVALLAGVSLLGPVTAMLMILPGLPDVTRERDDEHALRRSFNKQVPRAFSSI